MTHDEFLQQHAIDGELTAEQAAQLLELGDMGDTGITPDNGSVPSAAPVLNDAATAATDDVLDPAKAVILAKDGIHTIPYEKLIQARESEQAAKAALGSAQAEIESLRAQAQQRADSGQAPTLADANLAIAEQAMDSGIDPGIFGDFSEEDIAKGVQTLVSRQVEAAVSKALEPYQANQRDQAEESHFKTIYDAHPDTDSIVESKEMADWIGAQPGFARSGYEAVLKQGTASEVVEMLDAFKSSTGRTQPAAAGYKSAAKAAVARAQHTVPASLSDIPGGTAGPASKYEALAQLEPAALAEALGNMSAKDRDAWLEHQM